MGSSALTKIVRFDSKKIFLGSSALVRSSALAQKIVCFGSKDRLLSSSRSSAFSRIVCFRLYPNSFIGIETEHRITIILTGSRRKNHSSKESTY